MVLSIIGNKTDESVTVQCSSSNEGVVVKRRAERPSLVMADYHGEPFKSVSTIK